MDTRAAADVLAPALARGVPLNAELDAERARVLDAEGFDAALRRHAGLGEQARLASFCLSPPLGLR